MPTTPTYPGVYIEEIPSGVRTITGVVTSIAALVGRTRCGPVNEPVIVNGFGDFERVFGGLWEESPVSHAVRDFYLNGGSQAIVVRLFHPTFPTEAARQAALNAARTQAQAAASAVAQAARAASEEDDATAESVADAAENAVDDAVTAAANDAAPLTRARANVNGLNLEARYEGAWGNGLRARVDYDTRPPREGEAPNSLFNLSVRDDTGQIEQFRNVSVSAGHPRQVDKVLLNESALVRLAGSPPGSRPTVHANPRPGEDVWGDNDPPTNTRVADADQASDGSLLGSDDFIGAGKDTAKEGLY